MMLQKGRALKLSAGSGSGRSHGNGGAVSHTRRGSIHSQGSEKPRTAGGGVSPPPSLTVRSGDKSFAAGGSKKSSQYSPSQSSPASLPWMLPALNHGGMDHPGAAAGGCSPAALHHDWKVMAMTSPGHGRATRGIHCFRDTGYRGYVSPTQSELPIDYYVAGNPGQ